MSVLINDMEKPKFCYAVIDGEPKRCPFVDAYDDCVILRKKGIRTGTTWTDMYSKCPLVEVPEPHGDLIDRDILEQELRNGIKAGNLEGGYENYANINSVDDCVECVRYADIVIEAEGE